MGTKASPGAFDCYANAEPDEPMFVLLGRDPMASLLIELWAAMRELNEEDPAKVAEAQACADACRAWAEKLGRAEQVNQVLELFDDANGTDPPEDVDRLVLAARQVIEYESNPNGTCAHVVPGDAISELRDALEAFDADDDDEAPDSAPPSTEEH